MTRVLSRVNPVALAISVTLALIVSFFVVAYLRHSWPFTQSQAATTTEKKADEDMSSMPGMAHESETGNEHAAHASAAGKAPSGYAPLTINPERAGALDLTTAPVEEREFTKKLRTVGVVALDETRSAHVHSKVRGWIDGIYVNFVGRKIKAGEPLCSIYSQEVYAAENEFVSILGRGSPPASGAKTGPDPLVDAARRRLSLWDVPQSEVARLEATREPRRTFPLLAPRAGVVVSKQAIEGMYVDPSVELYTLSDLSRIWVLADVYEADVAYVHVGDHARLALEGQPNPIEATVGFISPTIDEATRTLKVRFELENKTNRLRPGAFVSVEMSVELGRGLAIPESAVIRTGARSIVFVAHGTNNEHIEPREVTLGPLVGEEYRVEAGVVAGEHVAVGAQFLLDSESRLRATSKPAGAHAH